MATAPARWAALTALAGLLAACATPAPPPPPAASAPVQAPAPEPAPAPPPPAAPEGPAPGTPAAVQAAHRLSLAAAELLEQGQEDQGLAEVQKALALDPHNRVAASLLKQIQSDPVALLGRESFVYRVQPGESLSRIAQRFLGDLHMFYALARYNDLKVPRQLQGGQNIRVPGKAPAPSAAPAPAAAPPVLPPSVKPAAAASQADDGRNAERDRQARISAAVRAARSAFARQDLNAAIKHWDSVLELDPSNSTAQLERKKAIDLRDKLGKVK